RPDVVKAARTTVAPAATLVNFMTMIPPVARLSLTAEPDETVALLSAWFRLWRSVRARTMGAGGTRVMPHGRCALPSGKDGQGRRPRGFGDEVATAEPSFAASCVGDRVAS